MEQVTSFRATTNKEAQKSVKMADYKSYQKNSSHPASLDCVFQNRTFAEAYKRQDGCKPKIIQKSFSDESAGRYPVYTGFVGAVQRAYDRHHDLYLRADDVWQAILTQFSFYVNGNSEGLRDTFVDFHGKKDLTIHAAGTLFTVDFGRIARRMVDEQIVKNIKDPSISQWIIPSFSTTTETDRIAAAVSIMSALQAYFAYNCCLSCGIPNVHMLGTLQDWKDLRAKVDRLTEFDAGSGLMKKWQPMLVKVLDQFVQSKEGKADIKFWDTVCSHIGGGSGPSYLSGWITTFGVFDKDGKWQGDMHEVATWGNVSKSEYPIIETSDLPSGVLSVPMLVDDNGTEYDTMLFAGQFCFERGSDKSSLRPKTDWCIAFDEANPRKAY